MFENSNKEAVREIARESMRAHRLRNLTAILGNYAYHPSDYHGVYGRDQLL